jgi:hypothetical protein
MSWLRTDDAFSQHPKFEGWTSAQKWAWLELMHYCARYRTAGRIPNDLTLLPRSTTEKLLERAETSGWIDRDRSGDRWIHDWRIYNPKDPTAADRMARKRNRDRNEPRNNTVTAAVTETSPRARARAGSRPVPSPNLSHSEREEDEDDENEQTRIDAWRERARQPDVRSATAFALAGIRGGGWPDVYQPTESVAMNMPPPNTERYVRSLIANHVITEPFELDDFDLTDDLRSELRALL